MRLIRYISLSIILCLKITVFAQEGTIRDSEISPEGNRLALADTTAVWIYTLPDLAIEAVLPVAANAVSWSPDNDLLAVGAQNGEILEWTISTRTAIRRVGHTESVLDLEWAAGGDYIASVSRDSIRAWQVGIYGNSIFLEETPFDYAADVSISPDGQMLASGTVAGQLNIWATEGGERGLNFSTADSVVLQSLGSPVFEETAFAVWSQDGQRFVGTYSAIGRDDSQAMIVYDSSEIAPTVGFWTELFDIDVEDVTAAPMFSPNGEKLARVHGTRVDLLNSETWDITQTVNSSTELINLDWTPNSKILILTTSETVGFYDLWTDSIILMLNHAEQISAGQLSDTQFVTGAGTSIQNSVVANPSISSSATRSELIPLATAVNPSWLSNTNVISADNASHLEILQTLELPFESYQAEWQFDWSPDGRVLVTSGGSTPLSVLWFVEDEASLSRPTRVDFGGSDVIFSRDGRLFALVNSNNIQIWDIEARQEMQRISPSGATNIEAAALSPDGTRLITGNRDPVVQVWDLVSGELIDELNAAASVRSVAYSPDAQWIAAGMNDGAVWVWNANTLERVLSLRFESPRPSDGLEVFELNFTADGQYLVAHAIGADALAIWAIPSGQSVPIDLDTVSASDVVFHPSQTLLASIYQNHIWILDYSTGEILYDQQTGRLFATGRADVFTAAFPNDDSLIFLGAWDSADRLEIWDWQSDQMLASFAGTQEPDLLTRGAIRLHPNGALVAVQDGGNKILLYGLR